MLSVFGNVKGEFVVGKMVIYLEDAIRASSNQTKVLASGGWPMPRIMSVLCARPPLLASDGCQFNLTSYICKSILVINNKNLLMGESCHPGSLIV